MREFSWYKIDKRLREISEMKFKSLLRILIPLSFIYCATSYASEVYFCAGKMNVSVDNYEMKKYNADLRFKFRIKNDVVQIKKMNLDYALWEAQIITS